MTAADTERLRDAIFGSMTWHITLSHIPTHVYVYPLYANGTVGLGADIAKSYLPVWIRERRNEGHIVVELANS